MPMEIQVSGTDMVHSIQYVHLTPFASSQGQGQAELHFNGFPVCSHKIFSGDINPVNVVVQLQLKYIAKAGRLVNLREGGAGQR